MDFDSIRPILSGAVGGAIAIWLGSRWQRRQPQHAQLSNDELLHSHRLAVYLASGVFFAGIIAGITMYAFADFAKNDWLPLGLGVGGGCLASLLVLTIVPLVTGQSIRDAYAAFAISEKSSPTLVYGLLGLGTLAFLWAVASLAT